jgi:hypothetical protein
MNGEVDIATVRDMRDQILDEMRRGFAGVHERQDQTNGRVLKTEKDVLLMEHSLQTLASNIKTIFGMLNSRRRQRSGTSEERLVRTGKYPAKVVVPSVVAATVAISEALQRIVPALVDAFFK